MSTSSAPQVTSPPAPKPALVRTSRGLLQILGVGFGLAVIIGNTIGAGILRTPGEVAGQLPRVWIFLAVWVAGGLYALLGAFSVSELSAMTPRSGGYYVFARRALGEYAGFVIGWTDWLAQCGTTAAVAIVIGEYTVDLVPALKGRHVSVAAAATILLAVLQWRGIRWGSLVQNITSAAKALGFAALVAALFALAPAAPAESARALPAGMSLGVALILALQAVIYTYDGWYGVFYFGEEVRDPGRDIPRSMIGGVLAVMAIYLLVNLALLHVLPLSRIAQENLAVGTAAKVVFGDVGDTVIRVLVIISMLSSINAYHLFASRILFAMSHDRLLPRQIAVVNPGGTPTVALYLSTVAALLFLLSGSFEQVAAILAFFFVADYGMAYVSVFILRRREPDAPRPYRAWGYPWTTGLALAGSIAFLAGAIAGDTRNSFYALAVLAVSYPLYLAQRYLRPQAHPGE